MAKRNSSRKNPAAKRVSNRRSGPKRKMGVRYSAKIKAEVVNFVEGYNASNNRGGQSAAVEKYGISALTIAKWLKGANPDAKLARKSRGLRNAAAMKTPRRNAASPRDVSAVLARMTVIQEELSALRDEFDDLKNRL